MTKKQALAELKKTKTLHTGMLKPLGISFESFLKFSQLSDEAGLRVVNKLIDYLEKQINGAKIFKIDGFSVKAYPEGKIEVRQGRRLIGRWFISVPKHITAITGEDLEQNAKTALQAAKEKLSKE